MYNKNNNIRDELKQDNKFLYINVTEIILVHQCNQVKIITSRKTSKESCINLTKLKYLHQCNQVEIVTVKYINSLIL